jgi:hypothetical protein
MGASKLNRILHDAQSVPGVLASKVTAVMELVESLRREASEKIALSGKQAEAFSAITAADTESTIAILGDRGTGKTTLLLYACSNLIQRGADVVLPAIRPERFGRGDTVMGWVLASLCRLLEATIPEFLDREADFGGRPMRLGEKLSLLRNQEALTQREYGKLLPTQSISQNEFAHDAADLNVVGLTLAKGWFDFIEELRRQLSAVSDGGTPPLILIPVDDADLVPELLTDIFAAVRLLSCHPCVVFLMCLSADAAVSILEEHLWSHLAPRTHDSSPEHASWAGDLVSEAVRRQLAKALPTHLRISLDSLPPEARLCFRPIGKTESLLDLLKTVPLLNLPHLDRLSDLFDLGGRLGLPVSEATPLASPFAGCLSSNPRDLDQLWKTIQRLAGSEPTGHLPASTMIMRAIIDHGFEHSAILRHSRSKPNISWITEPGGIKVVLDVGNLDFGKSAGTGRLVREERVLDFLVHSGIRRSRGYFATEKPHAKKGEAEDTTSRAEVPDAILQSLFLAKGLAKMDGSSPFIYGGTRGDMAMPGGDSWRHCIDVVVDHESTDDLFWLVPSWDDYYDYYLYDCTWNKIVDLCLSRELREFALTNRALWEWLFFVHLRLICGIQKSRTVSRNTWDVTPSELVKLLTDQSAWEKNRTDLAADVRTLCIEAYALGKLPSHSVRDRDFCRWVDIMLPFAADPLVASDNTAKWICDLRSEAIGNEAALKEADGELTNALTRRIQLEFPKSWVVGTITLLKRFDPSRANAFLARYERLKATTGEEFKAEIKRLAESGVSKEVIARISAFGFTKENVDTLREVGLPSDYLDYVARRFGDDATTVGPGGKLVQ